MNAVEAQTKPAAGGGGAGGQATRNATGEQPPPRRRSLLAALLRALPWALGAAIGVAAGAYLTAVSGAGAPGAAGIEPSVDLVALPVLAFVVVLGAHLMAQMLAGAIRHLRAR